MALFNGLVWLLVGAISECYYQETDMQLAFIQTKLQLEKPTEISHVRYLIASVWQTILEFQTNVF